VFDQNEYLVEVQIAPNTMLLDAISSARPLVANLAEVRKIRVLVLRRGGYLLADDQSTLYVPTFSSKLSVVERFHALSAYFAESRFGSRTDSEFDISRSLRAFVDHSTGPQRGGFEPIGLHPVSLVATGGCFDGFHRGHQSFLSAAMNVSQQLVVFINTDRSVTGLKGRGRPIVDLATRIESVRLFLRPTDEVKTFTAGNGLREVAKVAPDLFIKGVDYWHSIIPETKGSTPPTPVLIVDSILELHTTELLRNAVASPVRWGQVRTLFP